MTKEKKTSAKKPAKKENTIKKIIVDRKKICMVHLD